MLTRLQLLACEKYLAYDEGRQTVALLVGGMATVFLAWKLPSLAMKRFMGSNFLAFPLAPPWRAYTQLTSVFSHMGLIHFGFNAIALMSIGSAAHQYLWHNALRHDSEIRTSTARYEYLASFIFAGLLASWASHAWTLARVSTLLRRYGSIRALQTSPDRILPSLGASGAAWGSLSICALGALDVDAVLTDVLTKERRQPFPTRPSHRFPFPF